MLMSDYQRWAALGIAPHLRDDQQGLSILGCMGLAGEAGEVVDNFKKAIFHDGVTLNGDKVILELGDVLWYVAALCTALGVDMGMVAEENQRKLRERYPEKYAGRCPQCGARGVLSPSTSPDGPKIFDCLACARSWMDGNPVWRQ